ncbi:MAG: PilT/PilU family type 4a pilus ATPase [Phycisphaerales bacterium]|nr:PilT/PilU family type 4a pilus ATPase [Phycisphaerales bacterium]MCI0675882.1 PilT/PilU family type 4a pilus ATPase [Phycisphaerales bacterium]
MDWPDRGPSSLMQERDVTTTQAFVADDVAVPVHHDRGTTSGEGRRQFDKYLKAAISYEASDLIVKVDLPPRIRVRGALKSLQTDICTPDLMFQIAKDVLDDRQYNHFKHHGQFDFAYDYDEDNRFRVNLFMARGKPSLACRLITSNIKTFESLHLPQILGDVAMSAQGLILFAGVTGSGKSTSIASMLQYINERKRVHIVTIEDPIEYIFKDDKATINQREIGIDCLNFTEALRALVRENPDVVLVGEMRDYETFEAAIRAAETGHLVFGTIHASSAWQTFGRIYDLFPEAEREQIRKLLAYNLRAIVYQKLLPTLHEDIVRIPAVEILLNTPIVQKYILEGREGELLDIIRRSHEEGMVDFTTALVKLVEGEFIHHRVAMEATPKPEELKMRLKGIS